MSVFSEPFRHLSKLQKPSWDSLFKQKSDTLYLCYCQEFDVSVVPCNTFTSFILYFKRRSPVRTKLVSEIIFFPADSMRVFPASLAEQVSQGTGVCALATSALLEG